MLESLSLIILFKNLKSATESEISEGSPGHVATLSTSLPWCPARSPVITDARCKAACPIPDARCPDRQLTDESVWREAHSPVSFIVSGVHSKLFLLSFLALPSEALPCWFAIATALRRL